MLLRCLHDKSVLHRRLSGVGALVVVLMGALVLVGWFFHIPALTVVFPGFATMKVNTALAFVAAGLAIGSRALEWSPLIRSRVELIAGWVVVVIGGLTLLEWVAGWNLGIDNLLAPASQARVPSSHPGRMSVPTALFFLFLGLGVLLRRRGGWLGLVGHQILPGLVLLGGALSLSGYAFGERRLYQGSDVTSIALHTSLGFVGLGFAALFADAERGLARLAAAPGIGSVLLRRTLPVSVVCLGLLFWIRLQGQYAGLYGTEFGIAIMFVLGSILLCVGLAWLAFHLNRVEGKWRDVEDELKQAYRKVSQGLAESEEQLRLFVAGATDYAIYFLDPTGRVQTWNEGAHRLKGYDADEITGEPYRRFFEAADQEAGKPQRLLERALAEGHGEDEGWRVRKDGSRLWISATLSPLRRADGELLGFAEIARDRSEWKRSEDLARDQSDRLQLAAETAGIGIWDWDLATNRVKWDERMHEVYGLTPSADFTVSFQTFADAVHPDDLPEQMEVLGRTAREGGQSKREFRIVRRTDGSTRILQGSETAVLAEDGRPVRIVGITYDVTEQRKQEQTLHDSLREITALKTSLDVFAIVAITDTRGTITHANDKFCEISGYAREELIGLNHRLLNSGEHPPGFFREMWRTIGRGKPWHGEVCNRAKDGSDYWVDTTIVPFLDAAGKPEKYVAIRFEITKLKQLEAGLKVARDEALEASRQKSEFLATMSHEIRTPMNAIIGMSGLLAETELNEEQAEMVQTVGTGAENLLAIINDILDFSKIEAGQLRLDPVEFDLQENVEGALALLAAKAHDKGIELSGEFCFQPECMVFGDAGRLRQVLLNLVGNGLKFTEHGEVAVKVSRVFESASALKVRVEVRDTGIGLSEDARRRLFQPFVQADGSITRRFGGSGLGLAISRRLLEAMGGQIGVESEEGQGSTFWFELDFARRGPLAAPARAAELVGRRILVVDDNETNRRILLSQLRGRGMEAEAVDGPGGISRLADASSGTWDLVLLDWKMPDMNGLEFARHVRMLPGRADLPFVVLSSTNVSVSVEDSEGLVAASLTKPVPVTKLVRCLCRVLGGDDVSATSRRLRRAVTPEPKPARSLRLLLVEDNLANQRVASMILAKMGHSLAIEENGELGLARLAREKFDAVLMDCQMPVMDGFEATRRIRAGLVEGVDPNILIVAMTAYARAEDHDRCAEAGMDRYLSKPVRPRELEKIINEAILRVDTVVEEGEASVALTANPPDGIDVRIWNSMRELVGQDGKSFLWELIDLYLRDEPTRLERLAAEVAARRAKGAADEAHKFAGCVGALGALSLLHLAIALESAARESNWSKAVATLDELQSGCSVLREALRERQRTVH